MARCELFNLWTCAVPQSLVRARPAALSLALVLDHRLNGRRHRRVRYAANRQNNRLCASTTLDGSQLIAALNGGYARARRMVKRRRLAGQPRHRNAGRLLSPGN
jgi:hypothetical protein